MNPEWGELLPTEVRRVLERDRELKVGKHTTVCFFDPLEGHGFKPMDGGLWEACGALPVARDEGGANAAPRCAVRG